MKRKRHLISLLSICLLATSLLLFQGCGNQNKPADSYKIGDFYPFLQNVKMTYEGTGSEFASYTVFPDFISADKNKMQIRVNNGGTETVSVLENKEGQLTKTYEVAETYYKENLTDEKSNTNEIILKEPLTKGTKWTLSDGSAREITGVDVSVNTPSGDYKTLEVTTSADGEATQMDYYAKGIGLVKTVSILGGDQIVSALQEISTGPGYDFSLKLFNFKVTDTDVVSISEDSPVTLKTNETVLPFLSDSFKRLGLMSSDTTLNSLWMAPGSSTATIDFSQEFVTKMNAGTTKETGVLDSVVNTVGYYFQVQKVILTIDGQPYSSGHILMKEGEAMTTTYQEGNN